MNFDSTLSQLILYATMATGAVLAALWMGIVLWTLRDMRARSRDVLAQWAATAMVAVLNVFGLIIYLMLRPRETLAEAYERSLEEEALLQGIEDKPMCPGCGRPANSLWQICPHCHTRLKKPCINCNQLLDLPWTLCPYCATPQGGDTDVRQKRRRSKEQVNTSSGVEYEVSPQSASSLEFIDGDDA